MPTKKEAAKTEEAVVAGVDEDGRHRQSPDTLIRAIIGRCWLKDFELHNLDYETHKNGEEPQTVAINVIVQDPETSEEFDFDGSGSYMGEAIQMIIEQVNAQFPEAKK